MKKITTLFCILLFAGLMATAQNPFMRDQGGVYLKINDDKVGIGTASTLDKLTVASVSGETPLGLIGFPNHYNPFITCYNSNSVSIWKLYASADLFTIGNSNDSTTALLVGRLAKGWFKINGTGSFTRVLGTTAIITHLETSDTTGIVLYNRAGTKYRLYISSNGTVKVSTVP